MDVIFASALDRLEALHEDFLDCLDGLTTEQLDWSPGADMNSLCVLAVHVTAAERFWIGIGIDDVTERDRPSEFTASGWALDELKARFAANIAFYRKAFSAQDSDRLLETVDISHFMERPSEIVTRGYALIRGLDHTAEHLGHAGMTRQLLERR